MILIKSCDLKKSFGRTTAVDGISLELSDGECLAILGPNGAGKTTTVEILEGLIEPDSGSVELFGLNYKQSRPQILEKIGVMLQETRLYRKFTVLETLQLFASFYSGPVYTSEVLDRMSLRSFENKKLEELSGGQLQRVYLACALIHRPRIVFLDEPTNGLDPQSRHELWNVLREYKQRGAAMVLTSHFMHEAEALADRIMILDQGKCLALGTTAELIAQYTKGHRLEIIFKDSPSREVFEKSFTILSNEKSEKVSDNVQAYFFGEPLVFMERVTDFAKPNRNQIVSLRLAQTTLEDVYLHLTGRGLRESK